MPNTGKRSQGCMPCRRMKVKCSETHPACERCARASRECTWPESLSIFRSMNEASEQRANQLAPRRQRFRRDGSEGDDHSSERSRTPSGTTVSTSSTRAQSLVSHSRVTLSSEDSITSTRRHSPAPVPALAPDWPAQALAYYLEEFTLPSDRTNGTAGYMDVLPGLVSEALEGSFLKEAVRSVALMALGNRGYMDRLRVEGRKSYGRSLRGLRETVARGEKGDSVVTGMALLCQYELISGDKASTQLWRAHSTGQRAIIGLRGSGQFETPRGRALFRITHISLQMQDIARCEGPSFTATEFPLDVYPHPHGRKQVEISTKVATLVYRARLLLEDKDRTTPNRTTTSTPEASLQDLYADKSMEWWLEVQSTADEAWSIVNESESWEAWAPGQWRYQEAQGLHDLDVVSRAWDGAPLVFENGDTSSTDQHSSRSSSPDALPHKVYVYCSLLNSFNWAGVWVATSKVVEALLVLHRALASPSSPFADSPPMESLLGFKLRTLADKLLASFPYMFGEIDSEGRLVAGGHAKCGGPLFSLWPLNMLLGLEVLNTDERESVLKRLEVLSRTYGIRQAGSVAKWRRGGSKGASNQWLKAGKQDSERAGVDSAWGMKSD